MDAGVDHSLKPVFCYALSSRYGHLVAQAPVHPMNRMQEMLQML